ncbi:MAG: hypothetical protein QOG77_37, partial [Solirubrobacteraceae bacterium]|nr:hypothetical protein [Solirubrobacteraceae bacterium]
GWSELQTGLAIFPAGILVAVLSPRMAWLVTRFGVTRLIVAGMTSIAAAYALFLPIGLDSAYTSAMLPTMALIGLGFTLVYGPLTIVATEGVDDDEQGLASGLFNTAFQFGAAIGLAVVASVVVSATGSGADPEALLDGYRAGLVVPVAGALLALVVTVPGLRRPVPA